MRFVSAGGVTTPQLPVIKFGDDRPGEDELSADEARWKRHLYDEQHSGIHENMPEYHYVGELDFLHPATIGFVRSNKNAAGFLSHAFHFPVGKPTGGEFESLSLENLQLISLLRFEEPRAYVLDHLPRMDHLSSEDIPTRELTEFELNGLEQLQADDDIVVSETENGLQMLGSLRAGNTCIDCHSVKRGDLLGAFSYQFEKSAVGR